MDDEALEEQQTEEAAQGGGQPRRLPRYITLAAGSFLVSGLVALIAGGYFARPPLSGLRKVPVVGRLIPAPRPSKPQAGKPEAVPTVAKLHPMPAAEISDLMEHLEMARADYEKRRTDLARYEERLKQLQGDLQSERDHLDAMMAELARRRAQVRAEREALEAAKIVATAEERKRLTKLAKIYEAQTPTSAAAELQALDQSAQGELAAKILAAMVEKKAAAVFDAMQPEVALALKKKISAIRYEDQTQKKTGAAP